MHPNPADPKTMSRTLQMIWAALIFGVVSFGVVACLVGPGMARKTPLDPSLVYLLAGVAVTVLVGGIATEKVLLARAASQAPSTPGSTPSAQATFQASLVGAALRESAGLTGGILTLLTGERLWALALGGAAVLSLLAAFPRAKTGGGIEPE